MRDIAAKMLKKADSIERMASTASNLKGIFVKAFREAARYVKVTTDALAAYAAGDVSSRDGEQGRENRRLREEISSLREEMETMREGSLMPPPHPLHR